MSSSFGEWHKSSYSGNVRQECVEVCETPARVSVRDTQHRDLGQLDFTAAEWAGFLHGLKGNQL